MRRLLVLSKRTFNNPVEFDTLLDISFICKFSIVFVTICEMHGRIYHFISKTAGSLNVRDEYNIWNKIPLLIVNINII